MRYETTVAELSPAQLMGLMVAAVLWVWLIFRGFELWGQYDPPGRVMLVLCLGAAIAIPLYNALTALAPVAAASP